MFDIKKNLGSLLFAGIIGSKKTSIVSLDMRYRKYEIFYFRFRLVSAGSIQSSITSVGMRYRKYETYLFLF